MGRQSFKTGYEYQAINTKIDDFNPKYGRDTYGGQFSRPAGAAGRSGDLQPRRLHVRRAQRLLDHHSVHRQPAPADALRLPAGRHQGDREADAEPRPALRVRDAAVGEGQLPHQLRSGDQHARSAPKDGSIYDRALVNPDRNNFAPRARRWPARSTTRRSSAPATASATSISTAWAARTCSPSTARTSSALEHQPDSRRSRCAPATPAPTTCFRTTQQGYPGGLQRRRRTSTR